MSAMFVVLFILLSVASLTMLERKVMGFMQRRISVNIVGLFGMLQPYADALKLLSKENVVPSQSFYYFFMVGPFSLLIFSLVNWIFIPIYHINSLSDFNLGLAITMAISSLGIYGIFLGGWAANSKFSFLGSMRSTAQFISYELTFSTSLLMIGMVSSSFSYSMIMMDNQVVMKFFPFVLLILIFIISALAEMNRAPFDNVEAESELVAGFFTEHGSLPFVVYFLAEYNSMLFMSALTAILFFKSFMFFMVSIICFLFVWVRASLPRLRYDLLLIMSWKKSLPVVISLLAIEISFIIFM